MIRALALLFTLSLPATAGEPIRVYLDGRQVGTLVELEYRLSAGEIHVTTNEIVYGCQQDRIFSDGFD